MEKGAFLPLPFFSINPHIPSNYNYVWLVTITLIYINPNKKGGDYNCHHKVKMEKELDLFEWKYFEAEIILLTVRWYLQFRFSYRDLVEVMSERGIPISHTTIMRWVHEYSPEIAKKVRSHLKPVNDSWRVDETYIKVKGHWTYLYRAVDSTGKTIDFMLSEKRDARAV